MSVRVVDRFRAMETFVSVVKHGGFSAAAGHLGISRAIISKRIQDLETELGARLFNRTTRTVALTNVGQDYCDFCNRILEEIEQSDNSIRNIQSEPEGALRVLVPNAFGITYISPAVLAFTKIYPRVRINLTLSDNTSETSDFFASGFDIIIRLSEVRSSSVIGRRLGLISWQLCASPSYVKRNKRVRDPADLGDHNCFVHTQHAPDNIWRFRVDKDEERKEVHVKVAGTLSANSVLVLRESTLGGSGIAVLPTYICDADLRRKKLVRLLPDHILLPERPLYVLYPDRRYVPWRVRLFVRFLSDWLADQPHLPLA
jgi:DNA-binding transcriptional LysR family regulator